MSSYCQLVETLSKSINFTESWIISSMPRGGLQIVQPGDLDEARLKAYANEFHAHDSMSWRAIIADQPVCARDCWIEGLEQSRYYRGFLQPANLRYAAAAPMADPILPGYAGAWHIYRTASAGPFTEQDVRLLADAAAQLNHLSRETRESRLTPECARDRAQSHRPTWRQIVLDSSSSSVLNGVADQIDPRILDQLQSDARSRLGHHDTRPPRAGRLAVTDSNGGLCNFHVCAYRQYPGLGEGPFVFYCLEPDHCDWQMLRASDVAADTELARLIPALQFMQEEFRNHPTLTQIAKTVHLSPFHFHRRFTQLLGITPKHFLLQCQIYQAKRMLATREKELVEIAAACGFAHQSHFTSRFKQAAGLTPTGWRRLAARRHTARSN